MQHYTPTEVNPQHNYTSIALKNFNNQSNGKTFFLVFNTGKNHRLRILSDCNTIIKLKTAFKLKMDKSDHGIFRIGFAPL